MPAFLGRPGEIFRGWRAKGFVVQASRMLAAFVV